MQLSNIKERETRTFRKIRQNKRSEKMAITLKDIEKELRVEYNEKEGLLKMREKIQSNENINKSRKRG